MDPTTRALLAATRREIASRAAVVAADPEATWAMSSEADAAWADLTRARDAWAAADFPDVEPSCRVGGDPPVPGVGWGIQDAENPWVHPVRSVQLCEEGWVVVYLTGGGDEIADHLSCVALYLPHAPADAPYWRRE